MNPGHPRSSRRGAITVPLSREHPEAQRGEPTPGCGKRQTRPGPSPAATATRGAADSPGAAPLTEQTGGSPPQRREGSPGGKGCVEFCGQSRGAPGKLVPTGKTRSATPTGQCSRGGWSSVQHDRDYRAAGSGRMVASLWVSCLLFHVQSHPPEPPAPCRGRELSEASSNHGAPSESSEG